MDNNYCFYENIIFVSTHLIITLYILNIHYLLSFINSSNCQCNNYQKLINIRNWFIIYLFFLSIIIIYNILLSKLQYCIDDFIINSHYIYSIIMLINVFLIIYFNYHLQSLINKCDCIKNKYEEFYMTDTSKYIRFSLYISFFIFVITTIIQIIHQK